MIKGEKEFLELLKAGLWNAPLDLSMFSSQTDWERILQLAKEQTVMGVITDGLSGVPREKQGERRVMMQFYARTMALED